MTNLVLAAALFFFIHTLVAGTAARYWLIAKIGRLGYMGLFSVVSIAAIVWMAMSYNAAQMTDFRLLWDFYPFIDWLSIVLMFPALVLAVIGLLSKNPMAAEQGDLLRVGDPAAGIMRVTRHPFLSGVGLWAILHLLSNGDLASVILFGTFLLVAAFGMASIDRKRARDYGADWETFKAQTSRLPFVAIFQGRNSLKPGEIGIGRIGLGVVAYAAIYYFHGSIFGPELTAF